MPGERLTLVPHGEPGRLVVFEGTDGAGKTTVLEMVAERLRERGCDVLVTCQPTPDARELPLFRRYLFQPEERDVIDYRALLCFMVGDRLQHVHEVIRPALSEGQIVLCDRYVHTMLATMRARGFGHEEGWVAAACRDVPQPDAGFLFEAPFEVASRRIRDRSSPRENYLEAEHLRRTQAAFRRLADVGDLHVIDTHGRDVQQSFELTWNHLEPVVNGGNTAGRHRLPRRA